MVLTGYVCTLDVLDDSVDDHMYSQEEAFEDDEPSEVVLVHYRLVQ